MMFNSAEKTPHDALMASMGDARCLREAAFMLVLSATGVEFDDEAVGGVSANVAALAQEYGASPEEVQQALVHLEPSLYVNLRQA